MDLQALRHLVAAVIDDLGGDSYAHRFSRDGWHLQRGSAAGLIGVAPNDQDPDSSAVFVTFPIMKVPPQDQLRFYRTLLLYNHKLAGRASFSIDDDLVVWLVSGRKAQGLSHGELKILVADTSRAADYFDDLLLDEFGRENGLA